MSDVPHLIAEINDLRGKLRTTEANLASARAEAERGKQAVADAQKAVSDLQTQVDAAKKDRDQAIADKEDYIKNSSVVDAQSRASVAKLQAEIDALQGGDSPSPGVRKETVFRAADGSVHKTLHAAKRAAAMHAVKGLSSVLASGQTPSGEDIKSTTDSLSAL